MKSINDILTVAFSKLKADHTGMTIYKDKHPKFFNDNDPDQFFVVNSLPVITSLVERATINVNIHVDEIDAGMPDHLTLDSHLKTVIASLNEYTSGGIEFYYESHGKETDHLSGKDYMNVRFKVLCENY